MMIRTDVNGSWAIILSALTPAQRDLILESADEVVTGIKFRRERTRISTNGALELLFAIACFENTVKGEPKA